MVVALFASLGIDDDGKVGVLCSLETLMEWPLLLLLVSSLLPFELLLASAMEPLREKESSLLGHCSFSIFVQLTVCYLPTR